MKKRIYLALLLMGSLSGAVNAQNITLKLTEEQYNQIKAKVIEQQKQERTQSYDWAQFRRYATANSKIRKTPKVVFMGNSITELWVDKDSLFFKNNNYPGRGISGQTSCEMLVRFRQDVIDIHPQIVVINAGTNDLARNNGVIEIKNTLGNIISMCELAKANHIRPIVASVLPTNHFRWRPELSPADDVIALNKMIKEYAQKSNITYIDYYSVLVDDKKGLPSKYSTDGVHPTIEGYKIMEAIALKVLK